MSKRSERSGVRFTAGWERGRELRDSLAGRSVNTNISPRPIGKVQAPIQIEPPKPFYPFTPSKPSIQQPLSVARPTRDAAVARAKEAMRQREENPEEQRRREEEAHERDLKFEMRRQMQGIEIGYGFHPLVGLEANRVVVTDTMREAFDNLLILGEFKEGVHDGELVISRRDHTTQGPNRELEHVYADVAPITGFSKPTDHNQFGVALNPHAVAVIRERVQKHKDLREKLGISPNRHENAVWQAQFDRSMQILLRTGVAEEAQRLAEERGLDFTFDSDPVELGIGVWPSIRVGKDFISSRFLTSSGTGRIEEKGGRRIIVTMCAEVPPNVADTINFHGYERFFNEVNGARQNFERRSVTSSSISGALDREFSVKKVREVVDLVR